MKLIALLFLALGAFVSGSANAASEGWTYWDETDRMTSAKSVFASVQSVNHVSLAFPYEGDTYGYLLVQKKPRHGVGVVLHADRGQLICGYSDCHVTVRFDDKPAVRFSGENTSGHQSEALFISDGPRFIASAVKAKRILVEALFYRGGPMIFEFSVADSLVWPPKPAAPAGNVRPCDDVRMLTCKHSPN